MFKFALNREVWWPIELPFRGEKGIEWVKCQVLFRLFDCDELQDMDQKIAKGLTRRLQSLKTAPVSKSDTAVSIAEQMDKALEEQIDNDRDTYKRLRDRTRDWKGIAAVDDDGKDVPFEYSEEHFKALMADAGIYKAFHEGLLEASRGAKAKN